MTVIIRPKVCPECGSVRYPDPMESLPVVPSKMHPGYIQHVLCDGSRSHVVMFAGGGALGAWTQCSEPLCEENYRYYQLFPEKKPKELP